MSQAETACSRSNLQEPSRRGPAPVLLAQNGPEPLPHMAGISNCGHCGALSEAKGMALREERLKGISREPGPSFLSYILIE